MPTYNGLISWKVRDENGNEVSVPWHAEITSDSFTELEAVLNAMAVDFDAPLLGRTVGCKVTIDVDVAASVKASPQAGSEVRVGSTISMIDSAGNRNSFFVPTVSNTKFNGDALNNSDTEISDLITLLDTVQTNGSTNVTVTDEDTRKLTGGYARGFRTSRKMKPRL